MSKNNNSKKAKAFYTLYNLQRQSGQGLAEAFADRGGILKELRELIKEDLVEFSTRSLSNLGKDFLIKGMYNEDIHTEVSKRLGLTKLSFLSAVRIYLNKNQEEPILNTKSGRRFLKEQGASEKLLNKKTITYKDYYDFDGDYRENYDKWVNDEEVKEYLKYYKRLIPTYKGIKHKYFPCKVTDYIKNQPEYTEDITIKDFIKVITKKAKKSERIMKKYKKTDLKKSDKSKRLYTKRLKLIISLLKIKQPNIKLSEIL